MKVITPSGPARMVFGTVYKKVLFKPRCKPAHEIEVPVGIHLRLLQKQDDRVVVLAEGTARLHKNDTWNRETGRQTALAHMVSGMDRDLRGACLFAYYSRRRKA